LAQVPEENFDFLGYSIGRFYGKDGVPYTGTPALIPLSATAL
jgi:RNA-directed DNA polymerase